MKYIKYFAYSVIFLSFISCNIEDTVKNASEKCEDEIAKIIQSVEDTCLTKDELLEIIYEARRKNDVKSSERDLD
jgi:hypothetical protein